MAGALRLSLANNDAGGREASAQAADAIAAVGAAPAAFGTARRRPCATLDWLAGEQLRATLMRSFSAALLVLLVALLLTAPAGAEPKFPPLTGRIVDDANLLSGEDRRALEADLKALEERSSDQLVIYTAPSLQGYEIEDFGYRLGRTWQIGQQGKDNGVILIVAPNQRKVRIEVGRGLEPELTDAMSRLIIENAILPAFRRGDFSAGIKAGVHDIRDVLLGDAEAVKARARSAAKRDGGPGLSPALIMLLLFIVLAFLMVQMDARRTAHPARLDQRDRRYATRDRRYGTPVIIPGSWGGGSGSWGGSGGGGFSGGGGSFGGGGASGGW
ncbi:MAG TPA: TPM domain-containing protein [Hyphomicrobiaceae bacterium]|nr:TPM domain-containing protein [Hyphomicrobiaceae bacterium]